MSAASMLSSTAGLRAPTRRTKPGIRAPVRAQAFPQGGSNGDGHSNASHSWSPHRKQLVEALTAGSGLARAPSVWYVDKDDDNELGDMLFHADVKEADCWSDGHARTVEHHPAIPRSVCDENTGALSATNSFALSPFSLSR